MHLHFVLLQFLDQCVDPFDAQAIEAVGYKLPVTMDSRLDHGARALPNSQSPKICLVACGDEKTPRPAREICLRGSRI